MRWRTSTTVVGDKVLGLQKWVEAGIKLRVCVGNPNSAVVVEVIVCKKDEDRRIDIVKCREFWFFSQ